MENKDIIEQKLIIGAEKARAIARGVLNRVRNKIGYKDRFIISNRYLAMLIFFKKLFLVVI